MHTTKSVTDFMEIKIFGLLYFMPNYLLLMVHITASFKAFE
jgi:hypothetical protein